MVFKEVTAPNQKIKTRGDLEEELGIDPTLIRQNEGEAALHGIFYDDTEYDYMQHMRDLGTSSEGCFVEATRRQDTRSKGKGKQKLEDALRETHLDDDDGLEIDGVVLTDPKPLLDKDILPSKNLRQRTYQDQQDVPDALAGFQPDMDPRLREVLEALEDEAYVDDDDDIFGELSKESEEISLEAFEESGYADPDDGWETDDTAKPSKEYKSTSKVPSAEVDVVMADSSGEAVNGNWMAEYGKFKKSEKIPHRATKNTDLSQSIVTGSSMAGDRQKKRKGAMTSSTSYSMTSSSLFRNEGLTLLDDRFDKIEREYAEDDGDQDGGVSIAPSTSSSYHPSSIRSDFDNVMDDFLGNYSMSGKKRVKRGGPQSGLEQLDDIVSDSLPPLSPKSDRDVILCGEATLPGFLANNTPSAIVAT